jgi:WD40 repeat protein
VFVTGESTGSGTGSDYSTVAYDAATGAQLWVSRYDGPGGLVDEAFSPGVSPEGARVFVTGETGGSTSDEDHTTISYDACTGAQLWVRGYNGLANGDDIAESLAVSPDGTKVVVTGQSDASNGYADYATVAYDASTGAKLWVRRYKGPANSEDEAFSIGVSPDGSAVFVTGGEHRVIRQL